jgi:hypothetical protein
VTEVDSPLSRKGARHLCDGEGLAAIGRPAARGGGAISALDVIEEVASGR